MALEDEVRALINVLSEKNRSDGGSSGPARGRATATGDEIEAELQRTRTNFIKFNSNAQNWSKSTTMGSFAAGLFGKETKAAALQMGDLQDALSENEQMLDTLRKSGVKATDEKYKEIAANIKGLESQVNLRKNVTMLSGTVSEGAKSLFSFSNQMMLVNAQYSAEMMGIMAEGGSGFQMMGAAMKNGVEKVNAANQAMAQFAQTAGQALSQMGGKFAPLAGMALQVMGQRAAAASEAQKILAEKSISILVAEGEKLIKTQQEMTGSGLIFANGLDGMVAATKGTMLRLEDMSAVVKDNKEALLASGLGMTEATSRIGSVVKAFSSTTGQFKNMDRALLALGFSYKDQAALAAETMGRMRSGANGQNVTNAQVTQATADYAKNLALLKSLSDGDVKAKISQRQKENTQLAFEMEKAKMSPKQRAELETAMAKMSDLEAQNLRERMIYGRVINQQGNILEAQAPSMRKAGEEYAANLKKNNLSVKSVADTQARLGPQMQKEILTGMQGVARANAVGKGNLEGVSNTASEVLKRTYSTTTRAVGQSLKEQEKAAQDAQENRDTGAQKAAVDAIQAGAQGAKKLQEAAVAKLAELAPALKQQYADQIAALKGLSTGIESNTDKMGLLIMALMAANFGKDLFKASSSIFEKFKNVKNVPGSGTISNLGTAVKDGFKGAMTAIKGGEQASSLASGATRGSKATMAAFESVGKVKDAARGIGSTLKSFATSTKALGVVGTVLTTGFAAYKVMDKQKDYEAAKAAGDQAGMDAARKEQGGAVGGAVGGIAGAGIGFMLGGPIGAAIGGYLGNMAGEWAGEFVGPYWDKMTAKMGDWYNSAAKGASDMWQSTTQWVSGKWSELGNFMSGVVGKFSSSFNDAKAVALGFVTNVKDKFAKTFPDLYKTLEEVFNKVSGVVSGLLDSVTKTAGNAWNWVKEKTGLGTSTPAAPQTATQTSTTTTAAKPAATPGATPPSASAVKIQPGALPEKKGLTAAEKAAVMETVATNTKYTNDLLVNFTKNSEKLQIQMLQKLDAMVGHSSDTASAAKKTAKNTG